MICFACCALWAQGRAWAQMDYVYGAIGKPGDTDNFVYALLDEALTRTSAKWGSFVLRTVPEVPRNRQIRELGAGKGSTTLAILGTAHDIGEYLRPILIPIDKGLVGYRLLLIRQGDQERFGAARNAADLKAFSFGQNFSWDDVDILRANGLTVQPGDDFEGLFQMLNRGRFDALPRGLGEIQREFSERKDLYPGLQVEKTLLIHYPLPVYLWFQRSSAGSKLSARLEEGLRSMIADGTYDAIFWKYNRAVLADLGLAHRRVLQLDNPFLPADTPLGDARLWLTPEQLGVAPAPR
jgi:hypothetical protein